ncbi:MAG: aldo/keto reductase [Alphaproteobacteria bacterium]|nr:aldo/keto reductase [Alphaproteobacteria bacterium]
MEYRNLGRSGLQVSRLCLGTMTFGEADAGSFMHQVGCDEPTSFAIMDRALDAGVQFWDTADVYGQDGLSERVIGRWFERSGRRDEVVLATKFRFRMGQGPNGTGASRRRIVAACEASLRRLNTDRIDLYQIHMQDLDTPEEETLAALDDLVRAGKVLYVGASNYAAYRLADAMWISETRNLARFVSLQMQYSLVHRELEREHVPLSLRHGLGIVPWSPLAGGFLTGKFRKDQPPPDGTRLAKWSERLKGFDDDRHWRILGALDTVAEQASATPAAVALAWLLHKPGVTSVLFGARTVEQLEDNLRAAELALSAEQVATLDEASAFPLGYPYDFMKRIQGRW